MEMDYSLTEITAAVSNVTGDAWVLMSNFLVLIVLTFAVFLFAMRRGGAGIISLNLALYAGYAIYTVFPYRDSIIGIGDNAIIQAIIAIAIFIIATIGPFLVTMRLTAPSFGQLSFFQGSLLALAASGFLMALGYHVFDLSNIYTFSDPINQLFAPSGYFFYWFVAPIIGLYFLAR